MPNERLRAVMAAGGWTYAALAKAGEVDPKSVERWVNLGRTPRRATALEAAEALGEDVHAAAAALRQARAARAISPELVALYEQRADIPASTFVDKMTQARHQIDVLVYAAVFLHEAYPRLNDLLRGTSGRRLRGPDRGGRCGKLERPTPRQGRAVRSRHRVPLPTRAEGTIGALTGTPGVEVRTHETTLYNSHYRAETRSWPRPMSGE